MKIITIAFIFQFLFKYGNSHKITQENAFHNSCIGVSDESIHYIIQFSKSYKPLTPNKTTCAASFKIN